MIKHPTLVIYWADDRSLLSYKEKKELEFYGSLIAVTPGEVLLQDARTGRKVAIRGLEDEFAPQIPKPCLVA